jgi:hypothetical protein
MTTETINARPTHRVFAATKSVKKPQRVRTICSPTNAERADWANEALKLFMARTGCDCEDSLADLLCDLMHWADMAGLSFADEMHRARYHYAAETAEAEAA